MSSTNWGIYGVCAIPVSISRFLKKNRVNVLVTDHTRGYRLINKLWSRAPIGLVVSGCKSLN